MVVVRGSKLNFPNPSLSTLVFEPSSLSLALMHSDSSFSLYHSLSPLSSSLLSHPRTVIPPPSSSSCFVSIQSSDSPDSQALFVVSGPHGGGSRICLRFYAAVEGKGFARARVVCKQKGIEFDERFGVVLVDCFHGVSVGLAGSVNFLAVNWVSGSEVWVFAAKLVGDGVVKLMRCAVIECRAPVFSIGICFGLLVLGEENGVRVFSLRQLVKGRAVRKVNASQAGSRPVGQSFRLPNGVAGDNAARDLTVRCTKCNFGEGNSEIACNCYSNEKNRRNGSGKHRAIRLQQDSCEVGTYFVAFCGRDVEASKPSVNTSLKATSIQALSPKRCLILDSSGNLHVLCLSNSVTGSGVIPRMRQLPRVTNVQKLAVLAESSTGTQTIWVSDGYHSLHVISISDMEGVVKETDSTDDENFVQISGMQIIFSCEKIEDVTPLARNAILILGQVLGRAFINVSVSFICNCFTVHELTVISYIWLWKKHRERRVLEGNRLSRSGSALQYLQTPPCNLVGLRLLKSLLLSNNPSVVGCWFISFGLRFVACLKAPEGINYND